MVEIFFFYFFGSDDFGMFKEMKSKVRRRKI